MKDDIGLRAGQRRDHLVAVAQIGRDKLDTPAQLSQRQRRLAGQPPQLTRGGSEQVFGQMPADEAIDTGN